MGSTNPVGQSPYKMQLDSVMQFELNSEQKKYQTNFASFVDEHISSNANGWDNEQTLPLAIHRQLADAGYLVGSMPSSSGGAGFDMVTHGLLTEEIGRGCGSVRNLVTVQGMVAHAIEKWGTPEPVSYTHLTLPTKA